MEGSGADEALDSLGEFDGDVVVVVEVADTDVEVGELVVERLADETAHEVELHFNLVLHGVE
nr:hypothetical protein [uncultured Muribaculum sp.]